MDIVERLRLQEKEGVFNLPESHAFVGWKEAADEIELLRRDNKFLNEENFDVMRKNAELVITLNQTIDSIDKALKILLEVDMLSAERVKDLVAKATGKPTAEGE